MRADQRLSAILQFHEPKVIMQFKAIVLALPLLALQPACLAQTMEKNNLPCVPELCVGDGMAELAKLQWVPAQTSFKINNKFQNTAERKLSEDDLKVLKALYPNAADAAPYLYEKQFDAQALAMLGRVTAACDANELFGNFGSAGAPTRVGISLMPSAADASRHVWTVTSIVREFPDAATIEQKASLTTLLKRRYSKFGAGSTELPPAKPGEGRYFLGGMANFGFGLSMVRAPDEGNRMVKHPMCGGDKAK
ncbi:MAG: hypothetical protein V4631_23695 [Pseudomonadota bacterium]